MINKLDVYVKKKIHRLRSMGLFLGPQYHSIALYVYLYASVTMFSLLWLCTNNYVWEG